MHISVLIKEGQREIIPHAEEEKVGAEIGKMQPQTKKSQKPLEAVRDKDLILS